MHRYLKLEKLPRALPFPPDGNRAEFRKLITLGQELFFVLFSFHDRECHIRIIRKVQEIPCNRLEPSKPMG